MDGNEIIMKDDTTPVGEEGKLVVSKLVTFQGKNQAVNRTFYVALFSDADCTQKVSNVKELKCEGAWSAYTVFEHLKDGTYYVAETDKDGNPVENTDFGFDVSYDGDITVSFTEQNTDSTLAITNDMTEKNPEYDKYLKEDDGDDGKEKKKTSTSKNNSSNKTTKKGKNSKTGDNSHILFYAALAAAALVAGSAEVYRRRRRATGRNKHDR